MKASMFTRGEKLRCRELTASAERCGRLTRPPVCQKCGDDGPIEAHHEDYFQPLLIEWLCKRCHSEKKKPMDIDAYARKARRQLCVSLDRGTMEGLLSRANEIGVTVPEAVRMALTEHLDIDDEKGSAACNSPTL